MRRSLGAAFVVATLVAVIALWQLWSVDTGASEQTRAAPSVMASPGSSRAASPVDDPPGAWSEPSVDVVPATSSEPGRDLYAEAVVQAQVEHCGAEPRCDVSHHEVAAALWGLAAHPDLTWKARQDAARMAVWNEFRAVGVDPREVRREVKGWVGLR